MGAWIPGTGVTLMLGEFGGGVGRRSNGKYRAGVAVWRDIESSLAIPAPTGTSFTAWLLG